MYEKKIQENFKISEQTLENGIHHIHTQPSFNSHFFIGIYVKTGSRFEHPKQAGISHFLEHMLFRGSKKDPSFLKLAEKFERYGGEWNAATGHEHTEYTYIGLNESALPLIKLFSEIIEEPLFLEPEKEKEIILREIEDEINEFDEFLDLDYHSTNLAWNDDSFKHPITGDHKSVQGLTEKNLLDYHKEHYTPENIVICTWGGQNSEEILEQVSSCFNFKKKWGHKTLTQLKNPDKKGNYPLFKFVKNTDNQYQVQLSFQCDGEWSEKTIPYTLLCHLLANGFSSRLSKKLREEKGYVYSVGSHLSSFVDRGLFNISFATTHEKLHSSFEELLKVLKRLKEGEMSQEEIDRAKEQEILELVSTAHNPDSYSFLLARNKQWGQKETLVDCIEKTKRIDPSSLQLAADELFQSKEALLVVMGNKKLSLEKESKNLIQKYLG